MPGVNILVQEPKACGGGPPEVRGLEDAGATVATSPAALASAIGGGSLITMLPSGASVRGVYAEALAARLQTLAAEVHAGEDTPRARELLSARLREVRPSWLAWLYLRAL